MLAYALSYDWSQGHQGATPDRQQHRIMVHKCRVRSFAPSSHFLHSLMLVQEEEVKRKTKR